MIGRQLEEMWNLTGREAFTIVEYGAGTGTLCHDLLDYLKNNRPFYDRLRYSIVEKSPSMRDKEKEHLPEKVSWHDSVTDIGNFTGCVLSNELLDNFSVHEVVMQEELMEVFVDYQNVFFESLRPAPEELKDYFRQLSIVLPKGFRTEVNLQATDWIREIAQALKKGFVLTIDYGYPSAELYREYRSGGTLMCYHAHQVNTNPYQHIGEQDITSHVNFSALQHWGLRNGLECCGFTEQGYFLRALGLMDYLRTDGETGAAGCHEKAISIYRLLNDIGTKLKVLIQRKGPITKELTGLAPAGMIV